MNSKRVLGLATTFREDEVRALDRLFQLALQTPQTSILARSPAAASVYAKILRMREKLDRGEDT